jgi:hypothetical protein
MLSRATFLLADSSARVTEAMKLTLVFGRFEGEWSK